jgi:hypothetical protein
MCAFCRQVSAYVVYLCFIAVSANPVGHCNPTYSDKENALALILGLGITFLSITGTVYFSSKNMAGLVGAHDSAPATTVITAQRRRWHTTPSYVMTTPRQFCFCCCKQCAPQKPFPLFYFR